MVREAAAFGTPSLLLEGSTASGVINSGKNGFLSTGNVDEMSNIIRSLVLDPEKLFETGLTAKNTLVRSWQDVVGEVIDRYQVAIRNYSK